MHPNVFPGLTHQLYGSFLSLFRSRSSRPSNDIDRGIDRDRGAVSLEQVLWFVAAGVSVAVIAAILWAQIRDKADDPVMTPVAP
jgi:hypothetical protein